MGKRYFPAELITFSEIPRRGGKGRTQTETSRQTLRCRANGNVEMRNFGEGRLFKGYTAIFDVHQEDDSERMPQGRQ